MFTPPSLTIALLMMITSAICWGSWANTYKGVKNYRFELFYWDYAIGIFLISLVLAFTIGSGGEHAHRLFFKFSVAHAPDHFFLPLWRGRFHLCYVLPGAT